jgi:hypothetical protein
MDNKSEIIFGTTVSAYWNQQVAELNLPEWTGRYKPAEAVEEIDKLIAFLQQIKAKIASTRNTQTWQPGQDPFADDYGDTDPRSSEEIEYDRLRTTYPDLPPYEEID